MWTVGNSTGPCRSDEHTREYSSGFRLALALSKCAIACEFNGFPRHLFASFCLCNMSNSTPGNAYSSPCIDWLIFRLFCFRRIGAGLIIASYSSHYICCVVYICFEIFCYLQETNKIIQRLPRTPTLLTQATVKN